MTDRKQALEEQIKADRKAGTPGPWHVDMSYQWPSKVRAAPPFNERWICDACLQPSSDDQSYTLANARRIARVPEIDSRILADAEATDHLIKRLKALQTYFDLSDEELDAMTPDERDHYKARAERAEDRIKDWIELVSHVSIEAGVCCCGDDMENHSNPMDCGHSPVDHGSYMADLLVEDSRATLAQINAEPTEPRQPTVKPLEWEGRKTTGGIAQYRIHIGYGLMNGIYALTLNESTIGEYSSEQAAKAAAQSDYERRILSSLAEGGE